METTAHMIACPKALKEKYETSLRKSRAYYKAKREANT